MTSSYPTEGARISAETGKSARQHVLDDANLGDDYNAVALYANFLMNTGGGRPSDCARTAVREYRANPDRIRNRKSGADPDTGRQPF